MELHNEAIFQAYNGAIKLAINLPHSGILAPSTIALLKGHIDYLTYNLTNFSFSPSLNDLLYTLHFNNSCSLMKQWYNMSQQECHSMMPEFSISNPFEQGLLYFYTRQNYFFYNNVTETFGHTSIYSNYFVRVYLNLITLIKE